MGKILFLGDALVDIVLRVPDMPPRGGEAEARRGGIRPGGGGANAACWAAWLGEGVALWARIGEDLFGEWLLKGLEARGLDLRWLQRDPLHPTGMVVALVDSAGERTMVSLPGANRHLAFGSLEGVEADLLYVSGYALLAEPGAAREAVAAFRAGGGAVALDPGPLLQAELLSAVVPELDILIGSPGELGMEPEAFLELGVREVVLKLGAQGCRHVSGKGTFPVPAYPLDAAEDTTGAGDAFGAGYVSGLLGGLSPKARCLLGGLLGALAAAGAFPPEVAQGEAEGLLRRMEGLHPGLSPYLGEVREYLRRRDPWNCSGSSGRGDP